MTSEYKTKQKDCLLNVLKEHKDSILSCDDIYMLLVKENKKIGIATLYRQLEKLVESGVIRKYKAEFTNKYLYQYIDKECQCEDHLHMICLKCNKLFHLDCEEAKHLIKHIEEKHHFKVMSTKVVLYGLCEDCAKHD